jgi:hypothetical protein
MKLVRSPKRPTKDAIEQAPGKWLVDDDTDGEECTKEDVPPRYDLPRTHRGYGKRLLRNVPAGSPDIEMCDDGKLRRANREDDPEREPEPVEEPVSRGYWGE